MTDRERQILRWIEEDPMISQQELARRAGITRSSVGVHISNLMKKGFIAGRGYVLGAESSVAVVGAANVDIGGVSRGELIAGDSNPGAVRRSMGGVGRNIAHNMALLGLSVRLVTALGEDVHADEIAASCAALGIDMSWSLRLPGESTSTYLFIADCRGEMALAVSDMEIYRSLTPSALMDRPGALKGVRALVLDANLPAETIQWICGSTDAPVFADPVSAAKADRLLPVLGRLRAVKPNRLEAELLSGVKIRDERSLNAAADRLLAAGTEQVYISLGSDGLLAADKDRRIRLDSRPERIVNTTGCGDAFTAGVVWGNLNGMDLALCAGAGMAAASLAAESEATINPALSADALARRMGRWEDKTTGSTGE